MQILPPAERVLHYCESKNWFNSRHANKTKEKYLKTEKELFDDVIVIETFQLIDRDHTNSIELDERYSMLKKNNYPVNISLLKAFFDKTDRDGNNKLFYQIQNASIWMSLNKLSKMSRHLRVMMSNYTDQLFE